MPLAGKRPGASWTRDRWLAYAAMAFGTICISTCLLYTSDAADERSSVDLGGRRILKKKKIQETDIVMTAQQTTKMNSGDR